MFTNIWQVDSRQRQVAFLLILCVYDHNLSISTFFACTESSWINSTNRQWYSYPIFHTSGTLFMRRSIINFHNPFLRDIKNLTYVCFPWLDPILDQRLLVPSSDLRSLEWVRTKKNSYILWNKYLFLYLKDSCLVMGGCLPELQGLKWTLSFHNLESKCNKSHKTGWSRLFKKHLNCYWILSDLNWFHLLSNCQGCMNDYI